MAESDIPEENNMTGPDIGAMDRWAAQAYQQISATLTAEQKIRLEIVTNCAFSDDEIDRHVAYVTTGKWPGAK